MAFSRDNNNSEIQDYKSFYNGEVTFLTGGQILLKPVGSVNIVKMEE